MIEIEKARIDCAELSPDGTYGKFVVEPLERGFGNTLGNALRRVLLSSLPGVAVTSIKIEGIQHEFSTVPGVTEDVSELILNLKTLSAKLYSDQPKTVMLDVKGPAEVKAKDIAIDDELEFIDPEMHIATLNEDAHLQMHADHRQGPRIRERGKEQVSQHAHRGHSDRLHLHPHPQGQLHGDRYPRGPDHRL